MDDVRAVMDAAGSKRAAIVGVSEGGPMTVLFAATYPERVAAAVIMGSTATYTQTEDHPWRRPRADTEAGPARLVKDKTWGTPAFGGGPPAAGGSGQSPGGGAR